MELPLAKVSRKAAGVYLEANYYILKGALSTERALFAVHG